MKFLANHNTFTNNTLKQSGLSTSLFLKSISKIKLFPKWSIKFIALACLIFPSIASAQKPNRENIWSVETSLTFPPAAKIYMLKASYRFSDCSDLGVGLAFQNWKNEDKSPNGQAHAYTLLLSYRYYFWKNFHAEIELWPAYNHFNSFVDGNTYKGFELWVEYKIGYRMNLTNHIYLNLQPGLAHGIWMQNKWPEYENYSTKDMIENSLIFVPQVILGWNFLNNLK